MAISSEKIMQLLKSAFPEADIKIIDLVGDSDHYEVTVISRTFKNLTRVAQHKLVMDALGDIVGKELHAISIKTYSVDPKK
jgi:stress-induced morphogen